MIIKKGIKGKNKGGILSILSICMSVLVCKRQTTRLV